MKQCQSCGQKIVFGVYKKNGDLFCSEKCAEDYLASNRGFCEACLSETTDETPGDMELFNNVGTGWGLFSKNKCSQCGSVIKTKWIYFLIPVIPKGKFRVLYTKRTAGVVGRETAFIARKLRKVSP